MLDHARLVRSRALPILIVLGTVLLAVVAGCGRNATGPRGQVPLTLRALAAGPGMAARAARAADDTVTYSTMLLVVREVDLRLAESEPGDSSGDDHGDDLRSASFARASDDSMGSHHGDDHGEDAGEHVESIAFRGPFVVDLLAQKAESLDTEMVPPGTYRSVSGAIGPLRASDWNAPKFPTMVGITVYLQGTVHGGGDFTYATSIAHAFKIPGRFTVEKDTPATAFLTFDTSHWLRSPEGAFLDPRDPANDLAIRDAIIRSIRAGMDDDHDGRCDDATEGESN